jgi:hypothetical protein
MNSIIKGLKQIIFLLITKKNEGYKIETKEKVFLGQKDFFLTIKTFTFVPILYFSILVK